MRFRAGQWTPWLAVVEAGPGRLCFGEHPLAVALVSPTYSVAHIGRQL
jgi:hypothetical protein